MARSRSYYYLVDRLDARTAELIRNALRIVPGIEETRAHVPGGVLEVLSDRDMEAQVRMACTVAGTALRMRLKKKEAR